MIDINSLKKGDIFYKSGINGVWECTMDDDDIQKYGSFAVKVTERNYKLAMITKEDYEHLYYTREEAEEGCKAFPADNIENLLKDDKWLYDLFYTYKTYMPDEYSEEMKEAIKIKTGIDIQ